jgi:protein-S-isoprenylcysteine O-methyltransferase Ste14
MRFLGGHMVKNLNKIDIGRLIALSIFTFFMMLNVLVVYRDLRVLSPINMTKAFELVHHLLIVFFYGLIVILYFLRSSASSSSKSFVANTIAVLTTFAPSALSLLSESKLSKPEIVFGADFIIVLGMVLAIYSLDSLGRSFSIVPQARKLIQNGPYQLVRHPLYVGELIGLSGVVFVGPTIPTITIFFLIVACQIYRALQEEKLLTNIFPEYRDYCLKTARFIPGVF